MSWSATYSHNLLLALDMAGAVVFWNAEDVTISSMCGIVMLADQHADWQPQLAKLKLWNWQIKVLRWLGPKLDNIQTHHCDLAIAADIARAKRILGVLTLRT